MPHSHPSTARAAIAALTDLGKARKHLRHRKLSHSSHHHPNTPGAAESLSISGDLRLFQAHLTDPDEFTISKLLTAASDLGALTEGTQLHALTLKKNLFMDVAAMNSLLNFYSKCGSMDDADKVFDEMPVRDVYTWTAMVSGYALEGRVSAAMDFFHRMPWRNTVSWNSIMTGCQREGFHLMAVELFFTMRREGNSPNNFTFLTLLKSLLSLQLSNETRGVHCCVIKTALINDLLIKSTLVDVYMKFGDIMGAKRVFSEISEPNLVSWCILLSGFAQNGLIEEAERVFTEMPEKNVATWNALIVGFVKNGMNYRAILAFVDMIRSDFRPNSCTITILLSGCSNSHYLNEGKMLHSYAIKANLMQHISVCNSMITMYGKQSSISEALLIFERMEVCDAISWTAMIGAYVANNDATKARRIFDRMPAKNLVSWNTVMFGYIQNSGDFSWCMNDCLEFFYEMVRSDTKPDGFTYNCALTACGIAGALWPATAIHGRALKEVSESNTIVGNSLINLYGKCGSVWEAESAFQSLSSPDMISWNALLTAYSQNGEENKAFNFFDEMRSSGVELNHITFLNLLTICRYIGDVKRGQEYFATMERDYGITPTKEHYASIVDLLGRAGLLREAEEVIRKMPVEADGPVWGALVGACRIHGDEILGRRAAEEMWNLEPENVSGYVSVAETLAGKSMWRDVEDLRELMRRKGGLKEPGCSWVDIKSH